MRNQASQLLRSCPICQPKKMPPPPSQQPQLTNTATKPGQGWSIDLAGPFPRDENDNVYLAVAVCTHSKWVEALPIPSKHAFRMAQWFYNNVLARWGRPAFVRTDNGTEWKSEFATLLAQHGIRHLTITVGNSKANGQVERIIRVFKDIIRKLQGAHPTSFWSDFVPDALLMLRHTTTRAHGFPPFTIVTGQSPNLLTTLQPLPNPSPTWELDGNGEIAYVEAVANRIEELHKLAVDRRFHGYEKLLAAWKLKEKAIDHPNSLNFF